MMPRSPIPTTTPPGSATSSIFIHDFVPVALAWAQVTDRFTATISPPVLTNLVIEAWNAEAERAAAHGLDVRTCTGAQVAVRVGRARRRADAVVVPIAWDGIDVWITPLEADVEIAGFGPDRLHVHLLGRSRLPATVAPCTTAASLHQRLAVAVVRHVLARLVEEVAGSAHTPDQTPSTPGPT
ncbi:MAG: hypothetical protein AAFN30_03155 [Actinomycetota bacterium]